MPLLQPIQLLGCILNSRADFISRLHYKPRINFVCATCNVKNGSRSGRRIVSSAFFLNFQSQGKVCAGNALFTLLTTDFFLLTPPALRAKISKTRVRICTLTLPCKKRPLNYPSDYFSDVIIDANRAFFYLFWTICLPCVYTNID